MNNKIKYHENVALRLKNSENKIYSVASQLEENERKVEQLTKQITYSENFLITPKN